MCYDVTLDPTSASTIARSASASARRCSTNPHARAHGDAAGPRGMRRSAVAWRLRGSCTAVTPAESRRTASETRRCDTHPLACRWRRGSVALALDRRLHGGSTVVTRFVVTLARACGASSEQRATHHHILRGRGRQRARETQRFVARRYTAVTWRLHEQRRRDMGRHAKGTRRSAAESVAGTRTPMRRERRSPALPIAIPFEPTKTRVLRESYNDGSLVRRWPFLGRIDDLRCQWHGNLVDSKDMTITIEWSSF